MNVEYVYVMIELANGAVRYHWLDFEVAKEVTESQKPERWWNPILIAVPVEKWLEFEKLGLKGEGNASFFEGSGPNFTDDFKDTVVAVPDSDWGYGARYREFVEANRKKFGLEVRV